MYPYGLDEDLIVRLELNFSEKVIVCNKDNAATYKVSGISIKYYAIFDDCYARKIGEMYGVTASIPYIKETSIYYQTRSIIRQY